MPRNQPGIDALKDDMWRKYAFGFASVVLTSPCLAQIEKHFAVEPEDNVERTCLMLNAPSGVCYVAPTSNPKPVNVYGHTSNQRTIPRLQTHLARQIHNIKVDIEAKVSESLQSSVTRRVFGGSSDDTYDKYKVYLSETGQFSLDLVYDTGEAFIDLSGLSVDHFKVDAGNADVQVSYMEAHQNQVQMDTFMATVDMGSLEVERINLAQAQHILADVGFGSMTLGFDAQDPHGSQVLATVGAGNLEVLLENPTLPVLIRMHNSALCHVKLPEDFEEIEAHVWVNKAYRENAPTLLTFDVEVSMGNLQFTYQED